MNLAAGKKSQSLGPLQEGSSQRGSLTKALHASAMAPCFTVTLLALYGHFGNCLSLTPHLKVPFLQRRAPDRECQIWQPSGGLGESLGSELHAKHVNEFCSSKFSRFVVHFSWTIRACVAATVVGHMGAYWGWRVSCKV